MWGAQSRRERIMRLRSWLHPHARRLWTFTAGLSPFAIERTPMVFRKLLLCCVGVLVAGQAAAQVELKTYADRNGYVDVQALTCAQLANTYQEDADYLTTWYSGWYNGLAKKHAMKVDRAKTLEHELIVYCKANQGKKVIQAIDVVFKAYRAEKGIKMKE